MTLRVMEVKIHQKIISFTIAAILIFIGCRTKDTPVAQYKNIQSDSIFWKQGQEVELTGKIYPSRANATYYIESGNEKSAHIKGSPEIDKLSVGAKLWIKGTIEYVHYERPDDYYGSNRTVRYGVKLPQTICYINVSEFKIINP